MKLLSIAPVQRLTTTFHLLATDSHSACFIGDRTQFRVYAKTNEEKANCPAAAVPPKLRRGVLVRLIQIFGFCYLNVKWPQENRCYTLPMPFSSSLHRYFGFSSFRAGQQEAIQSILTGRHTLVIMPTGAGKSLIFQLAALHLDGVTLVISPLIALMQDQVDSLERRSISATYINSTLPIHEQNLRLQNFSESKYRIVYIAPERLRNIAFLHALRLQKVSLLAVDEAHCISEWGHDFRPDYLHIVQARASMGNPLTVALTATATPKVQNDIVRHLGLEDAARIVTGFNRPNLALNVRYLSGLPSKLHTLGELLSPCKSKPEAGLQGAVIIYTGTRRDAEEVTAFIREVIHTPAEFYHAGLFAEERTRIQNDFLSGKLNVICATNAFGMGIDRADVRQVIHYSLPGSLEAYYQEAGRAGRDGHPARATLLYDPEDRALHEFFIKSSNLAEDDLRAIYRALRHGEQAWSTADELSRHTGLHPVAIRVGLSMLEHAGAVEHLGDEGFRMLFRKGTWDQQEIKKAILHGKEHIQHRQTQLSGIIDYAESNWCRRKIILHHFGDAGEAGSASCCDNCQSTVTMHLSEKEPDQMSPGERAALVILDGVRKAHIKVGREKLAQILHGSKAKDIIRFRHDRNIYYGKLAVIRQKDIEEMISQLIELGYVKIIGGEYPVLSLTPRGENAIKQKEALSIRAPKSMDSDQIQKARAKLEAGGTVEYTAKLLTDGLKPEEIARERDLAVGTIYSHCAQLIGSGVLELSQVILPEIQLQIEGAIRKAGAVNSVTPIKMLLPDSIDYGMIRCVLAAQQRQGVHRATPDMTVESFLTKPHPRPLIGSWQAGWSLGFHSRFAGGDWSRSAAGELTYRLKYEADTTVLPALIQQTLDLFHIQPEMSQAKVIIPVPSSANRKLNPVHVFCEALAGKIRIPAQSLVRKIRQTPPQKEMKTLAQKRANVAGAFAVYGDIKEKSVLLVDDLFDSGATLEEITRLLLRHGATRVNVLTLTRTIHSDT
jgi:ATP-dependent DNA helicase RecQ